MLGTVRSGLDYELEDQATALLVRDRKDLKAKGFTKLSDMHDWLTDHQLANRLSHEVYTTLGMPDPSIRAGMFGRAHNPLFGTRPRRAEAV